ncbi:serine hydrolase [Emticicia sp. SJ17W-69]|uniref:serine hydrolase n=1 Tax=Emticicia sp. SJ17W-69 TaxID=3421657 RepID=UPI003EB89647
MKNIFNSLIMSLLVVSTFAQSSFKQVNKVKIEEYLSKLPATFKVTMLVESIEGKVYFSHRADERVPSASVIKIPILIELMEKVKKHELSLDKIHTLTNAEKTGGSGILANIAEGKQLTIRDIAQEMIRSSDNTATNILIHEIGMEAINQNLAQLGMMKTRLNRVMMDTEAVKQGRENYVNVVEINALMRLIYNKKVATPTLCDEMISMLKNCADTATIPRNLPKDLIIAHKTGGLPYVRGDAAIIYTTKPFIISIFIEGFNDETAAEQAIGDLAEICWRELR